jgi:hypothetical protein
MTMWKAFAVALLFLLSCVVCLGQSSFKGLAPGKSTKADVERALGQAVREVSETLAEYKSDQEREQIFVQYRRGSFIIERIELVYPATSERSAILRSLNLPPQPMALQTNSRGKFEEYFSPASLVLTYAGADAASGVNRVGYYSRELFESAVAKVPRSPQTGQSAQASQTTGTTSGLSGVGSAFPPNFPKPPGPSATADRSGRSSTSAVETPSPRESKRKSTTTTRSYPPPGGRGTPMTVTTRSSPSGASQSRPPIQPSETPDTGDDNTAEKEITLSEAELRKLVGRYEFTQSTEPSLKEARVTLVNATLKITMGTSTYALIPISGNDLAVGGRAKADSVNFRIANRPGVKVSFLMSGNKVKNLFYVEEQTEPMHFAVAIPKP